MTRRSDDRQDSPWGVRRTAARAAHEPPARPEAELAVAIAHELKDRLAGISAGVQLLAAELGDGDPRRSLLSELRSEIRRVDAIALDLLSFAHPRALRVQRTDLRGLVLELLAAMSIETELVRLRVQVSIDEGLVLPIDPLLLEQTIRSLVLEVARGLTSAGTISVRGTCSSQCAILEVDSVSPGPPRADPESALEQISQSPSLAAGLELALARRNVEAHGGRLVLGDPARGARFRIELPREGALIRPPRAASGHKP